MSFLKNICKIVNFFCKIVKKRAIFVDFMQYFWYATIKSVIIGKYAIFSCKKSKKNTRFTQLFPLTKKLFFGILCVAVLF